MVYITLDELKEILPDIFNEWIDGGDESWEWIFQEIEQKCHIGTKCKGKKKKKYVEDDVCVLKSKIDEHSTVLSAYKCDINKLTKRVDELSNKVSNLSSSNISMAGKIDTLSNDIEAAKSMAQTAKQRTEVDYSKISKELKQVNRMDHDIRKNSEIIQEVYNRMAGRGATKEELDSFRNSIHKCDNLVQKYDALEKKEIPVVKKTCETCKYADRGDRSPCSECRYNSINLSGFDLWEAKDE